MAKKMGQESQPQQNSRENHPHNTALDGRYRQIGISAVAAAVRYQGVAKNPAYAPAPNRWRDTGDAAA
ncbi:MAG: hypothetical protein WCA56_02715 [Xanthobacteraceae bacterium]